MAIFDLTVRVYNYLSEQNLLEAAQIRYALPVNFFFPWFIKSPTTHSVKISRYRGTARHETIP